jgi:coenzyme F420-reducing hydrogenase alpha subunit
LKKTGNALLRLLGGRDIHPINVRVGGFYSVPTRLELFKFADEMKRARDDAVAVLKWAAGLPFPDYARDYEFVALRHPNEYPMNEGRIASSRGLDIAVEQYEDEFEERQVPHSTALQAVLKRRGAYLVGPLARYALNRDRLPPAVAALAAEAGLDEVCGNPFRSILVRIVEVVFACEEALRLITEYEPPAAAAARVEAHAGVGCAATEAPRGLLFHRYRIGVDGSIEAARIVPPTSQNQGSIEEDLRVVATGSLDQPEEALRAICEQAIRNHDPCISCATHFLKLNVIRA